MMKAKDKQDFIDNWEDYVNEFGYLGHSVSLPETWEEIKRLREDMRKLVHKVADENYGDK
jgi:hypothetical protein